MSADCFPRTADLPSQSPLFWVTHKDRYLRQLLIRDIQAATERKLVVYFADTERYEAPIQPGDDVYLREILEPCRGSPVDLLLETNGGLTDATEKLCSILRQMAPDLRVVVPRRAKSNGTVVALAGTRILMTEMSELGPIDPSIGGLPADFVVKLQPANPQIAMQVLAADHAINQTKKLATEMLRTGMMKGSEEARIVEVVSKLSSREVYHSHGSVIDVREAKQLGLAVDFLPTSDPVAGQFWLLRTMLSYDCGAKGYAKLFESESLSSAVLPPPPAP